MNKGWKPKLLQAASYLVCLFIAWEQLDDLGASEFGGGTVSGPLLDLLGVGALLFFVAALVTFFKLRIASLAGIVAALLCLPVSLYFLAPGPFRWILRGEYSVPLTSNFVWSRWTVTPTFLFALALLVSLLGFLPMRRRMPTAQG